MSEGEPFAATYYDSPRGRVFSLRSQEGGEDVSKIAVLYGGGGHQHAAGFSRPIGWEGDDSLGVELRKAFTT
jgi:nanoRNase/pAp phosphatase (c-di-AMP/oligoRNAs hydrolase)